MNRLAMLLMWITLGLPGLALAQPVREAAPPLFDETGEARHEGMPRASSATAPREASDADGAVSQRDARSSVFADGSAARHAADSDEAPAAPPRTRSGPSVRELIQMVRRASHHVDADRVQALVRRARLSGLVPTLKLSAKRGLQQDLSSSSTSDAERLAAAIGDDLSFEAALSFDLPRLVFASEEVRLLSVERWLAGDRRHLIDQAIKLYFQRKKLLAQRAGQPDPEVDLEIAEVEALLDALTDMEFGKALRKPRP